MLIILHLALRCTSWARALSLRLSTISLSVKRSRATTGQNFVWWIRMAESFWKTLNLIVSWAHWLYQASWLFHHLQRGPFIGLHFDSVLDDSLIKRPWIRAHVQVGVSLTAWSGYHYLMVSLIRTEILLFLNRLNWSLKAHFKTVETISRRNSTDEIVFEHVHLASRQKMISRNVTWDWLAVFPWYRVHLSPQETYICICVRICLLMQLCSAWSSARRDKRFGDFLHFSWNVFLRKKYAAKSLSLFHKTSSNSHCADLSSVEVLLAMLHIKNNAHAQFILVLFSFRHDFSCTSDTLCFSVRTHLDPIKFSQFYRISSAAVRHIKRSWFLGSALV